MTEMLGLDVIVLNAKTGEVVSWPTSSAIQVPVMFDLAATFLPGMPAEEVEKAYEQWMDADSRTLPITPGSVIRHDNYGLLVLDDKSQWGNHDAAMLPREMRDDNPYGWKWTLVFEAPVSA